MLIGEYFHSIDAKGRMNIPSKLKNDLGENFILTKGLDGCLFVYPMNEWERLSEKIRELPLTKSRNIQRFLFAAAAEVNLDKQGRILIPQNLREYANLLKDAVLVGVSTRAEIWSKEAYDRINEDITPENAAEIMEELGF